MKDIRCPTCQYFKIIAPEDHPCGFSYEGACGNRDHVGFGDLVGQFDSCPEWTESEIKNET